MNRILSAFGALLLTAAIVGEADAAGLFSSYPNSTTAGSVSGNGNTGTGAAISGTECIPADTYLAQGQSPQTMCISPSQMGNYTSSVLTDTAYPNVPIGSVAYSSFGNNTTVSTTTTYVTQIDIPVTFKITNINCLFGTTGNGNVNLALYGTTGAFIAKGTSTATASNNSFQTIALSAAQTVPRGIYWIAAQASNASDSIHTVAASTFINVLTTSVTGGVYNTFPATITIPTTFTANVGPICYVN